MHVYFVQDVKQYGCYAKFMQLVASCQQAYKINDWSWDCEMLHAERNTYLQTTLLVDSYKYGDGEKLKRLYIENLTKSIFLLVQIIQ